MMGSCPFFVPFFILFSQKNKTKILTCHSQLNIPFQCAKYAIIAQKSLFPDPVLKAGQSKIEYSITNDSILHIKVFGIDDRIVRVTVNNLLESLKTVVECFEQFG